jgi:hypothetical protein
MLKLSPTIGLGALQINWELALGVAGLIISLIGFPITIAQLLRTTRATEAVNVAVSGLKNRMSAFDHASECLRAGKSLEHSVRLLQLRQWQDAAATLSEVQSALHRLSVSSEGQEEARRFAGETSQMLLNSINDLHDAHEKSLDYNARDLIITLRKQANSLDAEVIIVNRDLYNV